MFQLISSYFRTQPTETLPAFQAWRIVVCLLVALSPSSNQLMADIIARYDFAGGSGAAAESSASVTAGDYMATLGTISATTGTHFVNGNVTTPTLEAASEFTVTVDLGMLNLTSLDFGYRTDNAEPEDSFDLVVRSSIDAFASDIFSETRTGLTGTTNNPVSIDLTGASFQDLTGDVTFRWFVADNTDTTNERSRIAADVILNGVIAGGAAELALTIDRDTGEITLSNSGGSALDFVGYAISSFRGGLDESNWTSIDATYDVNGSSATQISDDEWTTLTAPGATGDLSEFDFESTAGASLGAGQSVSLGVGAWTASRFEDLQLTYVLPDGTEVSPTVAYIGNDDLPFDNGDLDTDGDIDSDDWDIFRTNLGGVFADESRVQTYLRGDLNGDNDVDPGDFITFQGLFDAENGQGALQAVIAGVPEPSSLALLSLFALCGLALRKRRGSLVLAVVCIGCMTSQTAQAQFSENFDGLIAGAAPAQLPDWTFIDLGDVTTDADWQITDDATSGSNFGSLHLSQANTSIDFFQTNQPVGGALAIANNSDIDPVDVIDFDFALGGFADGSGAFLDTKLVFGFRDESNFHALQIVAGQANGTSTELDISDVRVIDGEVVRSNPFDTFSTADFSAGFARSPDVLHGQLIHDSLAGSVSVTITQGPTTIFTASVTDDRFLEDGTIGFGVNNDAVSFDNLVVTALPRLTLQIDPVDGDSQIINGTGSPIDLDLYEITSFDSEGVGLDLLDPVAWSSLEEQDLSGFEAGDGTGNGWEAGDASNGNTLVEAQLTGGGSTFSDARTIYLGEAVVDGVTDGIEWRYHVPGSGNSFITGKVEFTDVVAPAGIDGDYNDDGIVDAIDYAIWRENLGMAVALPNDTTPGTVTSADYDVWKTNFGSVSGSSNVSSVATPEPTSLALVFLGGVAMSFLRKGRRTVVALAVVGAVCASSTTASAIEFDRILGLGEEESGSIGASVTSSFDSTAPFVDVAGNNGAQYASVTDRPGAAADSSTVGISFDGTDDFLSGLRFGLPETSRGAIGTTVGTPFGNAKNYTGIVNRGMQVWAKPNAAGSGSRQSVMADTNQFGVLISDAATPSWILLSGGTEFDTGIPVAFDNWTHLSVVREFGVGTTLYIDGEAKTRTSSTYESGDTANLVLGSNTEGDETVFTGGSTDFYNGLLDQAELFTWGESDEGPGMEPVEDHGDFNFGRDNGLARLPFADGGLSKVAGDISGDGLLDQADIDAFVAGWLSDNFVEFADNTQSTTPVADINSFAKGDLNFDGATDITDAFILHEALLAGGAGGLNFDLLTTGVPEPGSAVLLGLAFAMLGARSNRCR